jgi:hypothetical protein
MSRLHAEREKELSAIWGSHVVTASKAPLEWGDNVPLVQDDDTPAPIGPTALRVPASAKKRVERDENPDDEIIDSDDENLNKKDKKKILKKKEKSKKDAKKAATEPYKLHCFIAPGTARNEIRELFEDYEPKVELRVTQKGNLLNKSHYCVLTFPNKAMGLHACLRFQGTNQMDTIGTRTTQLAIMRSRRQSKNRAKLVAYAPNKEKK